MHQRVASESRVLKCRRKRSCSPIRRRIAHAFISRFNNDIVGVSVICRFVSYRIEWQISENENKEWESDYRNLRTKQISDKIVDDFNRGNSILSSLSFPGVLRKWRYRLLPMVPFHSEQCGMKFLLVSHQSYQRVPLFRHGMFNRRRTIDFDSELVGSKKLVGGGRDDGIPPGKYHY